MAIAAEELRIGNLIYGVSDRVEIIKEISLTTCEVELPLDFDKTKLDDINPISLSDEWLERLGFHHLVGSESIWNEVKLSDREEIWWIEGIYFFEKDDDIFQLYLSTDEDTYHMVKYEIEFVHELQNIIFALTGKELLSNEML